MKKCLVLDLDNTLWGGVVGEDGLKNLQLGVVSPGNSFLAFQQAILDLHDRGIILAINSKNNYEEAMEVIRTHPNMVLKERHFSVFKINWNDKADNLRAIAKELNIGVDAMVFLDDDPVNRVFVRGSLPEVDVPDLPENPSQYAKFLASLPYFETKTITDEDRLRGNFYVTERLRKEEEKSYPTKEEFLRSLELELSVRMNDNSVIARLAQLTEKTNQFNVDKRPLSEEAIRAYMESATHRVFHARAMDKFGDHGIIAFALVETAGDRWHIQSFLLSCRVLGRGVEDAFTAVIRQRARDAGIRELTIAFNKSDKNAPAEDFVNKNFDNGVLKAEEESAAPSWVKIYYENI